MERSWSLSEDVDDATDARIDIREKSSANQALSTSSSGVLAYKVISSLHTGALRGKTSPRVSSGFHEGNENVKSSFSNEELDRLTETFKDFRQSDFRWMSGQFGRGRLFTVTELSSFEYRVSEDQTDISPTETFVAPAGHIQQPISSTSVTFRFTSTRDKNIPVVDSRADEAVSLCRHSPACTTDVENVEPLHSSLVDATRDNPQVLGGTSTAFDLSASSTVDDANPGFDLLTVNSEFLIKQLEPGEFGDQSETCTRITLSTNKSLTQALDLSIPNIALTEISSTAQEESVIETLENLTAEFWNLESEKLASDQIYLTGTDHLLYASVDSSVISAFSPSLDDSSFVPIGNVFKASVLTDDNTPPTVAVTTPKLTPDRSLDEIYLVPSAFVGFGDVITLITPATTHTLTPVDIVGTHTTSQRESDAVAYFTSTSSFGKPIIIVALPSMLDDARLHSSQLTDITAITGAPSVTSKNFVSTVSDLVSSTTTLICWHPRTPSLNSHDSALFPFGTLTFPEARNVNSWRTYSDHLLTPASEAESQEVDNFEKTTASPPALSGDLSTDNTLQPTAGGFNSLRSHSIVSYKLSDHTFPVFAKSMEMSDVSSIYLQPSSTIPYDSTFTDVTWPENDNTDTWPDAFNDPLAETTAHQPLSLQSVPVNQTVAQDTANDPNIFEPIEPASTVDISATMFITLDKSSQTSSTLSNFTDVVQATESLNTTHRMNTGDGETSARQMPTFNTTIIIASACAVLALVIFVVIIICCLRRRKRSKSAASRQEGDDLWVDLYRSNSSHQMPLPSLTTCTSAFEMTDILKSGSTENLTDDRKKDRHTPEAGSSVMKQMKSHRQISSFQIKNPKLETEQELELTHPVLELEFSEGGMDQAENWLNMGTSMSMASLPTTEVSYHTNVTDYNLAAVGHKFRAVYTYKPVCKGEMALKEGELVECKERDRNGWMFGYKPRTNEEGWFPAVYVDELSSDDDMDFGSDIPETYDILESNKLNSTDQYWTGIEHRVCYSYQSSVPGDLEIEPGQIVVVLQTLANGWWFAVTGNKCGWFPGSYVEMIIDTSTEEQPSNSDSCQLQDQTCVSTEAKDSNAAQTAEDSNTSQTAEDSIAVHTAEDNRSDTASTSLTRISELPEAREIADDDESMNARTDVANDTSKLNVSTSAAFQVGEKNELKEFKCVVDNTSEINSTAMLTVNNQTPEKVDTHPAGILSINSLATVCTDKSPHSQKRLENSLRPARPAPPPPKLNDSKDKKDGKVSAESNSNIQTSKTQDPVLKKPVILIHGIRPKVQKVLRSQLDEKQLNPMIRPSTRGFIPKPTAFTHSGFKQEYSSTAGEHAHSSHSITHDPHSERMMMFSQPHNTGRHISPSQSLNFKPLSQQEYRSSKTSLDSCPETRPVYPRGSTPQNEQDKINHSNISNYLSQERSLTSDYRRERSLTPDYKRERSNSPILLTTGNLLQNVQRFHGALRHPIPLGNEKGGLKGPSSEKRDVEFTVTNTPPNTLSTFGRPQRAPTTAPTLKMPPIKSLHNKQTLSAIHDHNSEDILVANMSPIHMDSNRENTSNRKQNPINFPNSDNTTPKQDSFVVTPGTVSEIVQQINKQSPLQTELLQKLKADKRHHEPTDFPIRQNILEETHAQRLLHTDHIQNTTSDNGFRDVTCNNEPTTAL